MGKMDNIKTMCCKSNYEHISRAKWVCEKCRMDVSLEFLYIYQALDDEKERDL